MRRLEKRSARILAIFLALIMISSGLAALMQNPSHESEKRMIKKEFKDFKELSSNLNTTLYLYINYKYIENLPEKDPLRSYVLNLSREVLDYRIFNRQVIEVKVIDGILIAFYDDYPVYFVESRGGKIFFAGTEVRNLEGFNVKLFRNIALVENIEPFAIGFYPLVYKALKDLKEEKKFLEHLERIKGSFAYAFFLTGDYAIENIKSNNTSICDFFFEGYRYDEGYYEKVWAINFISSFFFVKDDIGVEHYDVEMFDDGFGIAVIKDKDFEKVLKVQPEVRGIVIVQQ